MSAFVILRLLWCAYTIGSRSSSIVLLLPARLGRLVVSTFVYPGTIGTAVGTRRTGALITASLCTVNLRALALVNASAIACVGGRHRCGAESVSGASDGVACGFAHHQPEALPGVGVARWILRVSSCDAALLVQN